MPAVQNVVSPFTLVRLAIKKKERKREKKKNQSGRPRNDPITHLFFFIYLFPPLSFSLSVT